MLRPSALPDLHLLPLQQPQGPWMLPNPAGAAVQLLSALPVLLHKLHCSAHQHVLWHPQASAAAEGQSLQQQNNTFTRHSVGGEAIQ